MVRVYKDWVITGNSQKITLGRTRTRTDKETGMSVEYVRRRADFSTVSQALQAILDIEERELLTKDGVVLSELIKQIESLHKDFSKELNFLSHSIEKALFGVNSCERG